MPSTESSLVLDAVSRLSPSVFEPFVHSLARTGYRGRLGLVLADYNAADRKRFEQLADFAVSVTDEYPPVSASWLINALGRLHRTKGLRRAYPHAFTLAIALGAERNSLRRW